MAAPKKKLEQEQGTLVLIDESGLLMAPLVRRTLAHRGQTPVLRQQGKHRQKVSVIAAVTVPAGPAPALGLYFQTHPDAYVDAPKATAFLEELLREIPGPVTVLWDRGNMHKGPALRALRAAHPRLTVEYLPPYAPDLNPVEHLWNHLKYGVLANFEPRSLLHLHWVALGHLEEVQQDQQRLQSFVRASHLPLREWVALAS